MPGESERVLTVSVSRQEFEDLTGAWAAYLEATQSRNGPIDPVLAMQRTGSVLRSLERVMAHMTSEATPPAEGHSV